MGVGRVSDRVRLTSFMGHGAAGRGRLLCKQKTR